MLEMWSWGVSIKRRFEKGGKNYCFFRREKVWDLLSLIGALKTSGELGSEKQASGLRERKSDVESRLYARLCLLATQT